MRSRLVNVALVFATLVLGAGIVAGCGGTSASKPTSSSPRPPSEPAASSPAGARPAPTWPTTTRTAAALHIGYLTAILVGRHSGYDRTVFTFSEGVPGYTVGYVSQVVSDPSGKVVTLAGQAFLRIVFHPSTGYPSYTGPSSISPGYPTLLQVRAAGDFESYLSFGIGLSQRVGFRVFALTQPYRVVIDVAHRS